MPSTLLLGLVLCSMGTRVFPNEVSSVKTNDTKRPTETIVIQRELEWGNGYGETESRLANMESEIKEVKSGIADLKSLIMKMAGNGNGGNASQQVGGNNETSGKGDNVIEDKDSVATTAAATTAAVKRDCTNAEDCFSAFWSRLTWDEARRSCQAQGADLATISSREELRRLKEYLKKKLRGYDVWIGSKKGVTDGRNPGNWKWITGEPIPTDGALGSWHPRWWGGASVQGLTTAGCLVLMNYHHYDFGYNHCYREYPFVCSKKN